MKLQSLPACAALILFSPAALPAETIDPRVEQMTLEEKAAMVTGQNAWQTFRIERLGNSGMDPAMISAILQQQAAGAGR